MHFKNPKDKENCVCTDCLQTVFILNFWEKPLTVFWEDASICNFNYVLLPFNIPFHTSSRKNKNIKVKIWIDAHIFFKPYVTIQ